MRISGGFIWSHDQRLRTHVFQGYIFAGDTVTIGAKSSDFSVLLFFHSLEILAVAHVS